ncbi:MAG: alpha/beta fold hydrolase [Rhizobiaceae bacterium]
MSARLHTIEAGPPSAAPVVLLHGFGMVAQCFSKLIQSLCQARHTLAFDLPGHGGSLGHPLAGSARKCAEAVVAEVEMRGVFPAHLVGHSFGGAVAVLAAILRPGLFSNVTLLAPGGFGSEINAPLMRRHASAQTRQEVQDCLDAMSPSTPASAELVEIIWKMRQMPDQAHALQALCERFLIGNAQGVLPLEKFADTGIPARLVWGEKDPVVPAMCALLAPACFEKIIIEGAGHMLPEEAPARLAAIILENPATA